MSEASPGWYLNVETNARQYWDGSRWTDQPAPEATEPTIAPEVARTAQAETSNLAVIALIFSFAVPFVGWILGFKARRDIAASEGKRTGGALATASIWIGGILTIAMAACFTFGAIAQSSFHHDRDRGGFGSHRPFDGQFGGQGGLMFRDGDQDGRMPMFNGGNAGPQFGSPTNP